MRAYRLCAAISRASSRPRFRLRLSLVRCLSLVHRFSLVHCALVAGLFLPSALAPASEPMPAATPNGLQSASRGYFGILGEVTCPGVYELPGDCTFGQLLRRAGGVTRDATGNTRVFRGGRVAQQLFVASSDAVALSPGDLIVIERRGTRQPA